MLTTSRPTGCEGILRTHVQETVPNKTETKIGKTLDRNDGGDVPLH